MATLSDLPRLVPHLGLMSVHGRGRGGGEVVARKLQAAYAAAGLEVSTIASTAGTRAAWCAVARLPAGQAVLLTAGPRDLPLLLMGALRGRPCVVYLQVPFAQAMTWRDPLHACGVLAFLVLVRLVARRVLVNSLNSARGLSGRDVDVVWPLSAAELRSDPMEVPPRLHWGLNAGLTIDVVCRLAIERGAGSRDIEALARLLSECKARNATGGAPLQVRHFGECAPSIQAYLQVVGGSAVRFEGHRENWLAAGHGPVVLLSRYEGFGLAAFEASRAGRRVYVNEAFPDELIRLRPAIARIQTSRGQAILPQLVEAR